MYFNNALDCIYICLYTSGSHGSHTSPTLGGGCEGLTMQTYGMHIVKGKFQLPLIEYLRILNILLANLPKECQKRDQEGMDVQGSD